MDEIKIMFKGQFARIDAGGPCKNTILKSNWMNKVNHSKKLEKYGRLKTRTVSTGRIISSNLVSRLGIKMVPETRPRQLEENHMPK